MVNATQCAFCFSEINPQAKRCPHCTEWVGEGNDPHGIEAQRVKLQWFLFLLPLLFAVTYGLAWGILYVVMH
jgi:hypothetical protein